MFNLGFTLFVDYCPLRYYFLTSVYASLCFYFILYLKGSGISNLLFESWRLQASALSFGRPVQGFGPRGTNFHNNLACLYVVLLILC